MNRLCFRPLDARTEAAERARRAPKGQRRQTQAALRRATTEALRRELTETQREADDAA